MRKVVLLGAGASAGTLPGKAPVAAEFGEYLPKEWGDKYPNLHAVVKFLVGRLPEDHKHSEAKWGFDKVWGAIDNRVKLKHILGLELPGAPCCPLQRKNVYEKAGDGWSFAGFELRCAITRIYGELLDDAINSAARDNGTLKQELAKLSPGDCVVSFNYDLLAEKILKELRKENEKFSDCVISSPYRDSADNRDAVLLCKPHGSLNWKQRVPEEGQAPQILEGPMREEEVDWYPQLGRLLTPGHLQPLVVEPIPFKEQLLVWQLQQHNVDLSFALLVQQWRDALQRIAEADELIVMGYGFPREDIHATYMFADRAAGRRRGLPRHIKIYETNWGSFRRVKKNVTRIFRVPPVMYVEYCGPVKP